MSWRDQLQPGSFRGTPFLFETSDSGIGRRIALHPCPLSDTPSAEDLGRQARDWTTEVFVFGPDYLAAKNALAKALATAGPGTLPQFYYGTRSAVVNGKTTITEPTSKAA